ncbi:MAG TPA: HAD family phosphatase [Ktedonobacterales bacterium]|nr:HAD family phosphatase [Ktedonobacterales bacterium]
MSSSPPSSSKPSRRLVIFDHDGLMVNTEDVVFTAYSRIFGPRNIAFPWDYYVTSLGMPVADSLAMYLRDLGDPMTLDELAEARAEQMRTLIETDLRPMPGLTPLLDALQARGDLLAVATSGTRSHIDRSLARFGLASYFDAVVCIKDVARGKPHPDLILEALRRTNVAASDAIMLEDAPLGVEAAHRAGVFCIAVPTHGVPLAAFTLAPAIARDLPAVQRMLVG